MENRNGVLFVNSVNMGAKFDKAPEFVRNRVKRVVDNQPAGQPLNQLQYEKCGLGNAAIGYIYIIATLLGGCGVYSARFTKRVGMKAAGIFFGGAAFIACMVLAFTESALLSVGGILLLRISNSLFLPFQTEIQNRQIQTECRATALSIHAMVMDSIAVGTNLIFGALAQTKLTAAYFFGAGICIVSVILFLIWYQNTGIKIAMHKE